MLLSRKAYEILIGPHTPITCKEPGFPKDIVFTTSECGTCKHYKDAKSFIVVFPETSTEYGFLLYAFWGGQMSNFVKLNAVKIHCTDKTPENEIIDSINNADLGCGEQRFKLACAALHIDPKDDSLNEQNLGVFKAICNASEPKKAKAATFKLKDFNAEKWDKESRAAMQWVQMAKLRDPEVRDFLLKLAQIAKDHNILASHVFFAEATAATPAIGDKKAIPADIIWGTGVGLEDLLPLIVKESNSPRLWLSLAGMSQKVPLYPGTNFLGLAINSAFAHLCGRDFEGLAESMEEFIARVKVDGFSYFKYTPHSTSEEPEPKRARSDSPIARTLSA